MTQDEAEKLARHWIELHTNTNAAKPCGCGQCRMANYILSGDLRREIENAAYERAAKTCEKTVGWSQSGDRRVQKAADFIRDLIQPPAPVTPSATKEVMPNTFGPKLSDLDNATPPVSTSAPGASAPEPDFDMLADAQPVLGDRWREAMAVFGQRMYRLGLTRAQGDGR